MYWWLFFLIVLLVFAFLFFNYFRFRYKPFVSLHEQDWRDKLPTPDVPVKHSVFLIGDAGAPNLHIKDPVLELLKMQLDEYGERATAVFLGDNIYPIGLPPEGHRLRPLAEKRMLRQIEYVKEHKGRICFLSGNHDWNRGMRGGYKQVLRQEQFVEKHMQREDVYLPKGGCPDPVEIELTDNLTLLIINTQWWVQRGERPIGKEYNCKVKDEDEFFTTFSDMVKKNKEAGKHVVVAAHHPMYSNSAHGGKFPVKEHLFPLSALVKRFYLPLPLIGSIYPYYRKFYGPKEDMSNPIYRRLRRRLLKIFKQYEGIVYAGGHDHNLQYFNLNKNHYIVSGSGSKVTYVSRRGKVTFAHRHKGFFEIQLLENNELWMHVWEPRLAGSDYLAFSKRLDA